ncbi:MAG: hypothetical protein ABWX94_00560 [Candidatus Saccharimonadales bacterium]
MQPKQYFSVEVQKVTCDTCPVRAIPEATWEGLARPEVESPYFLADRLFSLGEQLVYDVSLPVDEGDVPLKDDGTPYDMNGLPPGLLVGIQIQQTLNTINADVIALHKNGTKDWLFGVDDFGTLRTDETRKHDAPELEFPETTRHILQCLRNQIAGCHKEAATEGAAVDRFIDREMYFGFLESVADVGSDEEVLEWLGKVYLGLIDSGDMTLEESRKPKHRLDQMNDKDLRERLRYLAHTLRTLGSDEQD